MWGWPLTQHSSSSNSMTPPTFQPAMGHFTSVGGHHNPSAPPFSHTSQQATPLSTHHHPSAFPHSFYPLEYANKNSIVANSSGSTPSPWNLDLVGGGAGGGAHKLDNPTPNFPHHHHSISSVINDAGNDRLGDTTATPVVSGLTSNQQRTTNTAIDHQQQQIGTSFNQHSKGNATNSPFSMDFILQKSATPIDNSGLTGGGVHYNEQQSSSGYSSGSYQPQPIVPPTHNQYNQTQQSSLSLSTHTQQHQTHSSTYEPAPVPDATHELHPHSAPPPPPSYTTVTTSTNSLQTTPYNHPKDQNYPTIRAPLPPPAPSVTDTSTDRTNSTSLEQFHTIPDTSSGGRVCHQTPTDYSVQSTSTGTMIEGSVMSSVQDLPATEESYSPPELVLKKTDNTEHHQQQQVYQQPKQPRPYSDEEDDEEEDDMNDSNSGSTDQPLDEMIPRHGTTTMQSTTTRALSFSMEDDEDGVDYDGTASGGRSGGGFVSSGGFQLAVSPPQQPSSSHDSILTSNITASTQPSDSASSTSSDSTSTGSSSSSNTSVSSTASLEKKASSVHSNVNMSSSNASSSSSNNSDDQATLGSTTTTVDVHKHHQHPSPPSMVSDRNEDTYKSTDVVPSPPAVNRVPTIASAPAPPPLVPTRSILKNEANDFEGDNDDVFLPSPVVNKEDGSGSVIEGSLTLNKGERKTASVVVGKRGRAAGRILDEEKLRLPLNNGWQRIVRTRLGETNGPTRVDICYVTPCKRRLRTFPEIQRYIDQNRSPNLTIDNFSFSKKVNVGMIINEETLMNNTTVELGRPRRGRPPKHLIALKEKERNSKEDKREEEGFSGLQDPGGKRDARISLEPHEIGINKGNFINEEKMEDQSLTVPPPLPPSMTNNSSHGNIDSIVGVHITDTHLPSIDHYANSTLPPPLVKTPASSKAGGRNTTPRGKAQQQQVEGGEDRRGWKRKASMEEDKAPVFKKPRGRPKGSGVRSSGGRKPRIPKTVKYIPPRPQHPLYTDNTGTVSTTSSTAGDVFNGNAPATVSVIDRYSNSPIINGSDTTDEGNSANIIPPVDNPRIKKQLEDKEKRRRLLMKAREGPRKRRQSSTPHQRSQRKLAQQARRERERLAKHKQNEILKQKEVEMEEIRKSRIARQKENEYRQQALERTRNLMEQLRKQEEERERIMRLRQLDLERAEQLRRPTEDLLVKNLVTLPLLPKMELVCLSSKAFLDLVTIFQFTNSFEEFLELDCAPQLIELYCGLFNAQWKEPEGEGEEESEGMVVAGSNERNSITELLIQMVKAVTHDPGTKTQTLTGCSLRDIEVKEHTVSEILRLYLSKEKEQTIQKICTQLCHVPFPSLRPSDKTRVLSFLTEELLRSSSLCKEIDNRMEQVCTLRRIKWKISLKLKKFRSHFNDTFGAETTPTKAVMYGGRGRPPKKPSAVNLPNDVESSDEDGEGGGDDSSEDESDFTDEDSDEEPSEDRDELQRRIKEMKKKINFIRSKINTASKQMRVFPLGQDRFSRQYWNLPKMGGVVVEGIDTSTFDALEQYISDITYKREMEEKHDLAVLTSCISGRLSNDPGSRESSVVPPITGHPSSSFHVKKAQDSGQSSTQPSDSEHDSRIPMTVGGVDTPMSEATPNPSPPLSNSMNESFECSPDKSVKSSSTIASNHHPLEKQQLASNRAHKHDINDNRSTIPKSIIPNSSNSVVDHSVTGTAMANNDSDDDTSQASPWFSILPRKQCEVLHYLQLDASTQQQQQQGMMLAGNQFLGGSGYAYITPEGTILGQSLVQQVQMGYALVGNSLVQVPQTQYVMATPGGQTSDGTSITGATALGAGGGNQLISLGNGQYALAPAANPASSNNIQYVSINGNQYAIMQNPGQDIKANGVIGGDANPSILPAASVSEAIQPQPQASTTSEKRGKKDKTHGHSGSKQKSATPTPQVESTEQFLTLAIPGTNGEEPQYVRVPADPRVLSGEYSYAVLPQSDGTTQIVLVEKEGLTGAMGTTTTESSTIEENSTLSLECPHAVVMDNEHEGDPWCVDITLMYADTPLLFTSNSYDGKGQHGGHGGHVVKEENKDEKKLSQLLEQVDKDLTHGWWSINNSMELDHLIRCLTMRGFREKNLHKILMKNKDQLCQSSVKTLLPKALTTSLQSMVKESSAANNVEDNQQKPVVNEATEEHSPQQDQEMDDGGDTTEQMEVNVEDKEDKGQSVTDGTTTSTVVTGGVSTSAVVKKLVLPDGDSSGESVAEWDPFFSNNIGEHFKQIIKYLEGMETRLFDAHLPIEGSQKILNHVHISGSSNFNLEDVGLTVTTIADRLLRLEACVQRRYLKRPFKEKHADKKKPSPSDGSPVPVEEPPALLKWRNAVSNATSSSQLGVCMNQMERCIAWEKSPMKVFCVVCRTGDNESLLLLCDKCDRGTHTYCCKPKLDEIPEGNWYCHDCVINASRKSVCNVCDTARGVLLHCTECPTVIHKRCHNPPLTRIPNGPWRCFTCRRQNRRTKSNHMKDELILCYELLKELEEHDDSWPFLQPVDRKKVPGYYKVIKKPMDFSTVKSKLLEGRYSNKEAFAADARLVFDNCSYYNEDDSEIGIAGHRMKQFFEKKWSELSW